MVEGAPMELVSEKLAAPETPFVDAVTLKVPGVALAVHTADVAMPNEFVTAVVVPLANEQLAPLEGAANATVTPLIGLK
jgi:hypothetical protein